MVTLLSLQVLRAIRKEWLLFDQPRHFQCMESNLSHQQCWFQVLCCSDGSCTQSARKTALSNKLTRNWRTFRVLKFKSKLLFNRYRSLSNCYSPPREEFCIPIKTNPPIPEETLLAQNVSSPPLSSNCQHCNSPSQGGVQYPTKPNPSILEETLLVQNDPLPTLVKQLAILLLITPGRSTVPYQTQPTHLWGSIPSSKGPLPTLVCPNIPHLFHYFCDRDKFLFVILCVCFLLLAGTATKPFRRRRLSLQSWTLCKNTKDILTGKTGQEIKLNFRGHLGGTDCDLMVLFTADLFAVKYAILKMEQTCRKIQSLYGNFKDFNVT